MKVRTIVAVGAAAVAVTAGASVPAFASSHAAAGGKVSFTISQAGVGKKSTAAVVIHGAVNAAGRDTNPHGGNYDELYLNGGRLRVNHPDKSSKFTFTPNPKTCYYTFSGKGTGTFAKGTGKYKGYTGSLKYKIDGSGLATRKKSGSCDFNGAGVAFTGYVKGTGTLKA